MATLINGNGNLAIYAQQDADWYAALMGGQTVITAVGNQFAYELLASNTIGVKDGVIITKEGRRIQLDANAIDSFDIPTGAQGTTNYYIIGYHLVTGNQSEQTCETFVQLMENGTDTIPEGSFRDGDDEVFVSLYRVEQDDLTIGTITALLPQLSGSFQSQISELNNDLTKKALVNTYYDSNANKLYIVNPDGTQGNEIDMSTTKLIATAPSGVTYASQLTTLETTFNQLTTEEKMRAVILYEDTFLRNNGLYDDFIAVSYANGYNHYCMSISQHVYMANNVNASNNVNQSPLYLYLV